MLNIQADLRARLEVALNDVEVCVDVPAQRPPTLVVVRRDGGARDTNSIIDRPTIEIECWDKTEAGACNLANEVAEIIATLPFTEGYANITQDAMYSDFDLVAKSPRWYLSYSFATYQPKE